MKEIKKFGEWLTEKAFDNTFVLNEEIADDFRKDPNYIKSTEKEVAKNKDFFDKIAAVIGVNGKIPLASEGRRLIQSGEVKAVPFFLNDDKKDNQKLAISKAFLPDVIAALKKAKYTVTVEGSNCFIQAKDGKFTAIHTTGTVLTAAAGKEEGSGTAVQKYLMPETPAQESMIATILQVKAEGGITDPGDVPECVKKFLGEKKVKKLSAFGRWILSSNPVEHSGLCGYIDFKVPEDDVEGFQIELANFLFSGADNWFKSFEKLYNSNILQEISSVFKNGVRNWKQALFMHFWRYFHGEDLRGSWVEHYLYDGRCNAPKDNVDKADIFLCFNPNAAQRIVEDLMATKQREDYFRKMTRYINQKSFIGISLKKIGGAVTLSAVNFKTYTTAVGDNINPEKKVFLKFVKPGSRNNTLNIQEAFIKPSTSDKNVTYEIRVPFNKGHAHDLHMPDDACMLITCRSNGSDFGKITVEAKFQNAAANLGKLVEPLKSLFKYSPTETLAARINRKMTPQQVSAGYRSIAEDIIKLFKGNELKVYQMLAQGIGYPIQQGKDPNNVIVDSAPYIKIY